MRAKVSSLVLLAGVVGACHQGTHATPDAAAEAMALSSEPLVDAALIEIADAREDAIASGRAALEAGTYDGPRIGAMSMQTSIMSAPEWPPDAGRGSYRIGYLRHGATVAVVADPIINQACPDGWYELVASGYVCGKYATLDLRHPRVRLAPAPPDVSAALPYRYGYNLGNGTPLYRRVLSVEDRKKYEPWLVPKAAAALVEDAGDGERALPDDVTDSGAAPPPSEPLAAPIPRVAVVDASVPWFLRDYAGARPQVTLDDLHGKGVLVRRMVKGFYLALDRDFRAAHAHWWRTTAGFAVPFERVFIQAPLTDFHGMWLRGPLALEKTGNGTIAFVNSSYARKFLVDVETKKVTWGDPLPRRSSAELTGETIVIGGATYNETTLGHWIRPSEVMTTNKAPLPADLAPGEKWIDVNLVQQTLVAYEGETPVFGTLIASGKRNPNDKDKDHPTPPGSYRIREKHISATMDGDVAADGPYSIEDVPWVMYFQGSYALHGAFWHAGFGRTMSHGCVNMAPADARAMFRWTEPHLPEGWHGVFAADDKPGTRVVVREDPVVTVAK